MEMALLTNSPVGSPEKSFPTTVYNAYVANIYPATSLRQFFERHKQPTTSSVHTLAGSDPSVRQLLLS
jgi:hypothetical protein